MKKSKESLRSFLRVCQTLSVIVFAALSVQRLSAQNIAWSAAAGITGDANVSNAGIYFDAFLPNHQRIEMTGAQRSVISIRC